MTSVVGLKLRMYITLLLVFAIGFGIIYAIMLYLGLGFSAIIIFALLFFVAQWYFSPSLMKLGMHLHYLEPGERRDIQKMVKSLSEQAHVPMPKIAIAPIKEPNAFVFGRTVKSATLVIHQGLLDKLNDSELKAVLAHEIGHLKHSDIVVMAIVAFIPALALMISQQLFFRSVFGGYGGNRNNGAAIALIGIAAFLVYLVAQLLVLSLSRARESFADSHSASTTRKPEDLARALIKITASNTAAVSTTPSSAPARSLYIVDFFNARKDIAELEAHAEDVKKLLPELDVERFIKEAKSSEGRHALSIASLFSTHPSTYRRILDLAAAKKDL
ncbi:MAG: M48 family metalloprotease [Candidatus Micrarchaeia archaeon]